MKSKKLLQVISLFMIMFTFFALMAGCGNAKEQGGQTTVAQNTDQVTTVEETTKEEPKEDVVIKFATNSKGAISDENVKLFELAAQNGVKVEPLIVPDSSGGGADKVLISLMSGDEMDILYMANPHMVRYHKANVISPLDEIAQETGYDMQKVFGKYLTKFEDGKIYGLPAFVDIWLTLYNKKVFDDAKVPYPTADGWTWSKYVETAKLLTNESKGIYGSYMLDYDCYNYMVAQQKKVPSYKADGTSNFDDPAFADAMKFFYDLGNVDKIQPDFLTFKSKKLPWDGFAAGNYGMFVCGGWTTYLMTDTKTYPRDWKFGVLPMPYPDGQNKSTLTVSGNYQVASTSKHKKEAFKVAALWAEQQYTLGFGRVPARVDLTDADLTNFIDNTLAAPFKNDGITAADFKAAWFDNNQDIVPEKIIGLGGDAISNAFIEEGELYGLGRKSLEDAMKAIKDKADKAIEEEKAAK